MKALGVLEIETGTTPLKALGGTYHSGDLQDRGGGA